MNVDRRVLRNLRRRGVVVVTRRQWGNTSPVYLTRIRTRPHAALPSDTLWQHITVTERTNIRADMRTLHRIGMERFGTGVSYNFGVDMKTGELGIGASLRAKGAHTLNDKDVPGYSYDQNFVSHAIACIGMPNDVLSTKAQNTISHVISALIEERVLTRGFDYNPHSFVAWKDCPCDSTRDNMPGMRNRAIHITTAREQNRKDRR